MNNQEERRDVIGYEGSYQVSNLGRIKSVSRTVRRKDNTLYPVREHILKPIKYNNGYYYVMMGSKERPQAIHRIVAKAFIPNPNNHPQVNHKDEDKSNNTLSNLEWCTASYNSGYGTRGTRLTETKGKRVAQIDLQSGNVIKIWRSAAEAARELTGKSNHGNISNCCVGKRPYAYGYKWSYVKRNNKKVI